MSAWNGVKAVYDKEILSYFRSPIAYFVIAVFLLGTGYFFTYNIFLTGVGTMDQTFQNMGILLVVLVPVLTMRLFSGEYTGRTMELLMTLPLRTWQVVVGKYLGAVTILALMVAFSCINLVPLYLFGNPQTPNIIAGYIGFLQPLQPSVLLRDLFAHLSFSLHYADFIHGLLRSEAIVYFLVVAGVALTLNTTYLQWRR